MSQKVLKIFLSELLMHKGIFAQLFQKHLLIIYLQSIYLLFMFSFVNVFSRYRLIKVLNLHFLSHLLQYH